MADDQKPAITVRAASERDYPAVARIQQACPEAAQWPVGDYHGFEVLVAIMDDAPVGFCAWRRTAPGEAELLNLGVHPRWRRRGVAGALLDALGRQAGWDIFLEVAETNGPAIALYRRHGWEQIAIRPGYYHRGSINAIVMKKGSW